MKKQQLMHTFPDNDKIFDPKPGIEYHVATKVTDVFEANNELCIETTLGNLQKAILRVSVVDDFAINLKYSQKKFPKNKFKDHIVNKKNKMPQYIIKKVKVDIISGGEVGATFVAGESGTVGKLIETEQIIVPFKKSKKEFIITKNPLNIEIKDTKTKKIQFTLNWRDGFKYFDGFVAPGLGFKQISENTWLPFMSWAIRNDELTYGLGEQFGKLEKTNSRKTIWNSDTSGKSNADLAYSALPYILTTYNFGLLLDSGSKSYFDIGASVTDASSLMNTEQNLDIYLFASDSIKGIIRDYTKLTGRITTIHNTAYGIWYSKLYYHDKNETQITIDKAKENKLPIDVINIDPKWLRDRYTKSCNFEEATERFGDFTTFFKDMNNQGVKIAFWMNPYIQGDNSEFFIEAKEKNYLVKNIEGGLAHPYTGVEVYQSDNYLIDFTNPEAYNFWKSKVIELAKKGMVFVVNDYGDGVPEDAFFYNDKTGLEMRQYYTFLYNKAVYEGLAEVHGKDNVAKIARPGYIGSHKFPGKWGGDSYSRWSELKNSIQAGLSHSMSGEVLWGTDIGGFISQPEDELYIRWIQYGTFTPYTRMHGINHREPWHFSPQALIIARKYFELKRKWFPVYKIGELTAIKTGTTTMRPLVVEHSDDKIASQIDDQYLLNNNVLVAPVIIRETRTRDIYFPKGKWTNYFNSKETILGKSSITISAPLDRLPLYIKEGTILTTFANGTYDFEKLDSQKLIISIFGKVKGNGIQELKINDNLIKISYKWEAGKATVKSVTIKGWNNFKVKVITK